MFFRVPSKGSVFPSIRDILEQGRTPIYPGDWTWMWHDVNMGFSIVFLHGHDLWWFASWLWGLFPCLIPRPRPGSLNSVVKFPTSNSAWVWVTSGMPMDATKVSHVEFSTSKAAIFGASMNSIHIPETKTKTTHLPGTATANPPVANWGWLIGNLTWLENPPFIGVFLFKTSIGF